MFSGLFYGGGKMLVFNGIGPRFSAALFFLVLSVAGVPIAIVPGSSPADLMCYSFFRSSGVFSAGISRRSPSLWYS